MIFVVVVVCIFCVRVKNNASSFPIHVVLHIVLRQVTLLLQVLTDAKFLLKIYESPSGFFFFLAVHYSSVVLRQVLLVQVVPL